MKEREEIEDLTQQWNRTEFGLQQSATAESKWSDQRRTTMQCNRSIIAWSHVDAVR